MNALYRRMAATRACCPTSGPKLFMMPPCASVPIFSITLIKQTNYLLDQQIRKLEETFIREGGLRERMTRARLAARDPWQKEQKSFHTARKGRDA